MHLLRQLWVLTVFLVALACTSVAFADVNTTGLRQAVKAENVFAHQADLEAIADANGGTRDTRTQGYLDSVDYVVDQMESYGYEPQVRSSTCPSGLRTAHRR